MQLTKNSENPIDVYGVKCPILSILIQNSQNYPSLAKWREASHQNIAKFIEVT